MSYQQVPKRHSISDNFPADQAIEAISALFQPGPTYIEKTNGRDWRTIHGSLGGSALQKTVLKHVSPKSSFSLGTLARWYPDFLELDIDYGGEPLCHELQTALKLDDDQVQVCTTERDGGYRLRCRVDQDDSTATREYFYQKLRFLESSYGVEVYPRSARHVRLPFDSKLVPVGRCDGMNVNALVADFEKLVPLNLDTLGWPTETATSWNTPEESTFIRQQPLTFSLARGEEALRHGLPSAGMRYETQWDMMRVLRKRGMRQGEATHECFVTLQTKGYISKDIIQVPRKVLKELEWCARAIWNGEQLTDYIRKDALPIWVGIAGNDFAFLRFCLGVVSYLTARHEPGREISLPSRVLQTFAKSMNVVPFLEKLEEIGFIKRNHSYQARVRSKTVRITRPELLGTDQPYFDGHYPLGGLAALKRDTKLYDLVYHSLNRIQRGHLARLK